MDKMIDRVETSRNLRVELTQDELLEAATRLARAQQEISEAEDRKKEINEQIKAEIAAATAEAQREGSKIRNGYEYRDVACMKRLDYAVNSVTITREDTGEVIEDRAMRPDERQAGLDLPAA